MWLCVQKNVKSCLFFRWLDPELNDPHGHYKKTFLEMKAELDNWRYRSYPGTLKRRITALENQLEAEKTRTKDLEVELEEEKGRAAAEKGKLVEENESLKNKLQFSLVVMVLFVAVFIWLLINHVY